MIWGVVSFFKKIREVENFLAPAKNVRVVERTNERTDGRTSERKNMSATFHVSDSESRLTKKQDVQFVASTPKIC